MILVAYAFLAGGVLCFGVRALLGPSLTDRMTGVNGMLVAGMAAIVVNAVDTGRGAFLPALVVLALVNFVGTGMIARFVEGLDR